MGKVASRPHAPAPCPRRQSPASRARARAAGGSLSARWGGHRRGQYAVSTSNSPPGISDNPTIEAQSPLWRRPAVIWLLLYPFAWLGLFGISGMLWYLPPGLRLGTLWLLPRRMWPAMAVVEVGRPLVHHLALGYQSRLGLWERAIQPWGFHAVQLPG